MRTQNVSAPQPRRTIEGPQNASTGGVGAADYLELGELANRHAPEFDTHDRFDHRVDRVRFHPSYHRLTSVAIEEGLHSSHDKPGIATGMAVTEKQGGSDVRANTTRAAFSAEVGAARGGNAALDRHIVDLQGDVADPKDQEFLARALVDRMPLAFQASLLDRHAPAFAADAFCRARLDTVGHHQYVALPRAVDSRRIVDRAMPGGGQGQRPRLS